MNIGQVYWANLPSGRHPVVVVSRDALNRGSHVVVVPLTTTRVAEQSSLANCVYLRQGDGGLPKDCIVKADQIASILTTRIEHQPIGTLSDRLVREIVHAIGYTISAVCEPA